MSEFSTYWLVGGEKLHDWPTVEQRVLAGAVAVEISAEVQQQEAEQRAQAEKRHAQIADKTYREAIERQYERSPEGRRQRALQHAAKHPGGIVTRARPMADFHELDAMSREATNLFNR